MRRRRDFPRAAQPPLSAHLRTMVWGPAEFAGLPPSWLVKEGLLSGVLGVLGVAGAGAVGVWLGVPALADGEAGLVCSGALVLYLALVRAGRALVGMVAVLGVCLALYTPQVAAGLVLAERGLVQSVVVTSVDSAEAPVGRVRYLCSVTDRDGVPLQVRIWRGCGRATRPGDALTVVYDPKGRVPPRGTEADAGPAGPLRGLAALAAALLAACVTAVVRSYRLTPTVSAPAPATPRRG